MAKYTESIGGGMKGQPWVDVCVCFFHLSGAALQSLGFQEGRVESAETWPLTLRKGGRSSGFSFTQVLHLWGAEPMGRWILALCCRAEWAGPLQRCSCCFSMIIFFHHPGARYWAAWRDEVLRLTERFHAGVFFWQAGRRRRTLNALCKPFNVDFSFLCRNG